MNFSGACFLLLFCIVDVNSVDKKKFGTQCDIEKIQQFLEHMTGSS